jgi:urease accessory protein
MTATFSASSSAHRVPGPSRAGRLLTQELYADARITATAGPDITDLPVLDGDGPIDLRRLRSHGAQARVCLLNAMSAPHNGDRLRIEVTVEPGADLHITSATASIALPGPAPGFATYDITLRVGESARLHWLPEPTISAADSDLRQHIQVELAPTARLLLTEQQILGRAHEPSGRLASRLTVRSGGETLLDQHTTYGPGAPGWDGPAVLADNRATGQLLLIDPALDHHHPPSHLLHDIPADTHGVITPITGHGRLLTAVAPDAGGLRSCLDAALHHLELQPD